jgi:hypothetical protein
MDGEHLAHAAVGLEIYERFAPLAPEQAHQSGIAARSDGQGWPTGTARLADHPPPGDFPGGA